MCWEQPTTFARVIGIATLHICGKATAGATVNSGPCGLCVLSTASTAFTSTSTGTLTVTNQSILINGGGSTSATVSGSTIGCGGTCTGGFSPTPTHITPIADPLSAIPTPSTGGITSCPDRTASWSQDLSLTPGCYHNITSSSTGQITLAAGTYLITGTGGPTPGVWLTHAPAAGKTSLLGTGVTLYFTCAGAGNLPTACSSSGANGSTLNQSGGATLSLSGPTSGTYQNLTIFFDRHNTEPLTLSGTTATTLSGSLYAAATTLTLSGGTGSVAFNSLIVVGKLTKSGGSSVTLNFDPNFVTSYGTTSSVALNE